MSVFKVTGKILVFTGNKDCSAFGSNNGFPGVIATTLGVYNHIWWRFYRWNNITPVTEDNKKCCENCLRNCTDSENDIHVMVQECWSNNYRHWKARYLCSDNHSPQYNNCEDLMEDGSCAYLLQSYNCNVRIDLHSISEIDNKKESIKEIKKIANLFK